MDIEKLLGKLLQEAMGSSGSQFKNRDGYHNSSNQRSSSGTGSLLGSLTNQLTSGKGLMTAIGLGVGAYEIFRSGGQQPQQAAQSWGSTAAPSAPMPPPPPASPPTPVRAVAAPPVAAASNGNQDVACRLIRVMISAAHADGILDADEEKRILDRLRGVELSQEEKMFLLEELHHPRPIAELTAGISDLRLAQTTYAVALSAMSVDTDSERQWLDELGAALGLSAEIRRFIEETR
jgi:uncharacterized membrane protein YebE (DUF533 family)